MSNLRNLSLALALAATGAAPAVMAQSIHAGSETGSYTKDFCPEVEKALKKGYFEHKCTISQGTGDNVDKVLAKPSDVGIGQFDIVAARAEQAAGKLTVINPNIGLECLYAVTSDPAVTSLKGLAARMPVALPPEKSGATATFQYLQSLDKGLAELRKVTYYGSALEAVEAVTKGDAALAFIVQFPNTKNDVFKAINEAKLHFIPVINREILRREIGGQAVYQPQEVVVTPVGMLSKLTGKEAQKIETTCTPVVLFTGDPSQFKEGSNERKDQDELIKTLGQAQPPSSKDWKDVLKNTIAIGKDKVEGLIQKYSQ
ncbi:MAG: hypothetical protein U1F68_17290 [Gammaproteobacteria bacterium]